MIKTKGDSFNKLKETSRKYNGITATILANKKFHEKEQLLKVVQSIDRLVEVAKKKIAE